MKLLNVYAFLLPVFGFFFGAGSLAFADACSDKIVVYCSYYDNQGDGSWGQATSVAKKCDGAFRAVHSEWYQHNDISRPVRSILRDELVQVSKGSLNEVMVEGNSLSFTVTNGTARIEGYKNDCSVDLD